MLNIRRLQNGLQIIPSVGGATAPSLQGELAVDNSTGNLYYHNGTSPQAVDTASNTLTLTNKTLAVGSNNITSSIGTAAQFNPSTGNLESSITTSTELSYVHGVTSSIQAQLNAITSAAIDSLTGDVSATGPGAAAATVNFVGGSSAANVHSAELAANAATNLNTASTIVKRDSSGNFSAGTITANLNGNASGSASNVTGVVAIPNGGTGQTTASAAYGALSPMTTTGDIEYESAPGVASRLPIGANNQILKVVSGIPAWSTFTALTNPMTSTGDIIYSSDNLGTPTRLPIGNPGQALEVVGGIPTWVSPFAVLNASSTTQNSTVNSINTNQWWGQSFTATQSGLVSSVILYPSQVGGSGASGPTYVGIYTNNAGNPGTIIGGLSASIDASTFTSTPAPSTYSLAGTTVNIVSGTQYFLVFQPTGVTFNSSTIQLNRDNTNPYAGGEATASLDGGSTWTPVMGSDLQFGVLSTSGIEVLTAVGDVKSSLLNEAQFQSFRGTNWVLMDGRSVSGSLYAFMTGNSNIPDFRARFQRMKDNGAGLDHNGDLALGSLEGDTVQDHVHSVNFHGNSPVVTGFFASSSGVVASTGNTNGMASGNAAAETQPKAGIVNFFIKIN